MQRFKKGQRVQLKEARAFNYPDNQTLPAGSKGTILVVMTGGFGYRVKFDNRNTYSIVPDADLKPA